MNISQAKVFIVGAVMGAVFGAIVLASIAHLVLIGTAAAGALAILHRGRRRILRRPKGEKSLKA